MLRDSKLNFSYGKYICIDLLPPLFLASFFWRIIFIRLGETKRIAINKNFL